MERMQYHKKCHCIIFYCFIWEDMSKTRALCVIAGSKHLYSLMLSSVSWCLEPVMKHSPSFWHFIWKCFLKRKKFTSQIQTRSFRQGNLFPCLVPVRRFPGLLGQFTWCGIRDERTRHIFFAWTTWPETLWPRGIMRPRDQAISFLTSTLPHRTPMIPKRKTEVESFTVL